MDWSTVEAIEQIKHLKARYFRLMDQKRWDEWRELSTEDVTAVYHGARAARAKAQRSCAVRGGRTWWRKSVACWPRASPCITGICRRSR